MDKTLMIVGLCLVAAAAFACGLFIQSRLIRRAIERIFAPVNGAQPKGKETMPHFCPFAQDVLDAVRHELPPRERPRGTGDHWAPRRPAP